MARRTLSEVVIADPNQCGRCGKGRLYRWGMPLPRQGEPSEGMIDDRLRANQTCNRCGATWINGRLKA